VISRKTCGTNNVTKSTPAFRSLAESSLETCPRGRAQARASTGAEMELEIYRDPTTDCCTLGKACHPKGGFEATLRNGALGIRRNLNSRMAPIQSLPFCFWQSLIILADCSSFREEERRFFTAFAFDQFRVSFVRVEQQLPGLNGALGCF
jgi:hypothetical protein